MNRTSIEWTDYTWNPVTGCTKVSAGCRGCYAERMANRFKATHGDFKQVTLHPERLNQPYKIKKPSRIFVCDVSDLFHEDVPMEFIYSVWSKTFFLQQHTFQILTKRPERLLEFYRYMQMMNPTWPGFAPNLWFGISCENQATANERIPLLFLLPAHVRFLSCEPLLGPIDLNECAKMFSSNWHDLIHWVIAGGESGPTARPMHIDWVRSLRDQCADANVPFFFKQWGEWCPSENIDIGSFFAYMGHGQVFENGKAKRQPRSHLFDNGAHRPGTIMFRIGKGKSGNSLDGKQHLEFPQPTTTTI